MENEPINNEPIANPDASDDALYIIEDETAAGEPMNPVTRILSIFAAPGKLMDNLRDFPKLGVVSLTVIVLTLVGTFVTLQATPVILDALSVAIAERYGMDFLNMSQVSQTTQQSYPLAIVMQLIAYFSYAAISALFLLLATKIARGSAGFRQYFAMNLHRAVLTSVGTIIASALIVLTGIPMTFTSLAPVLMPRGNTLSLMFNLLSSIELFGIWSTVLLVIGLKKLNDGFSTAKAVIIGVIWYVIGIAFVTGAASSSVLMLDVSFKAMQQMR